MRATMYGIKACDTMKKARAWLDSAGVAYDFHDYKIRGIDEMTLRRWVEKVGWERLVNRAGTTFRKLPEDRRACLDGEAAIRLMQDHPSLIRRPVVEVGGELEIGFKPEAYAARFGG
jgi:arsenate reductase